MKLLAAGIVYPISDMCINYRKLNQATRKDHFPLPFIDQVICIFILHRHINIGPPSLAYLTSLPTLGGHLACAKPQAPSRESCMEVFIDDFTVYDLSFDACLESLSRLLNRCVEANIVLNFEKCHFMVTKGLVLGHNRGIEVGFYRRFIQNFSAIVLPLSKLL
ncbi:Retrovirus-related Pol polyprotein from transposon 17.6, partial [Mucuna pruriens]